MSRAEQDPTIVSLRELLLKDGHIDNTAKGEVSIKCPIPGHDDNSPSASANLDKGLWYCHACAVGGTAVDYLIQAHNYSMKDALQQVKGTTRRTNNATRIYALPDGEAHHHYYNADGSLCFVIVRRPSSSPNKKCVPFMPAKDGHEWRMQLNIKEGRPLYRLPQVIAANPTQRIVIFEGEKCVDTWEKHAKSTPATTWHGGCKAWMKTDWTPLQGRKVVLVSDADDAGRNCMRSLAAHLHQMGCDISIMLAKGDDGADVHDWIEATDIEKVRERIVSNIEDYEPVDAEVPAVDDTKLSRPLMLEKNEYFKVLGYAGRDNDQVIIIRNNLTKAMVSYSFNAITAGKLLALAPLDFWTDETSITNKVLHQHHSLLVNKAYLKGRISLSRIVGRGASKGDDGIVFHFGDAVMHDGKEYPVDDKRWLCYYPDLESLPRETPDPAFEVMLSKFTKPFLDWHFTTRADALIWLGWMASALAGGAQNWRPLLWMCAPAKSGKSFLQTSVLEWMGPYATKHDNYTDAAIMRAMESDSLLVMLDECEPDDIPPQMLASLRITTGNSGGRIRSERLSSGGVVHSTPRASVYLSSVQLPALRETEASRIIMCRLNSADTRTSHQYMSNLLAIQQAISDYGTKIRNMLVHSIPLIVARTNIWAQTLTSPEIGMPVRAAHVYAPIFAGCEVLRLKDELPKLREYLQQQELSDDNVVPSTAIYMVSQILSIEVVAEVPDPAGSGAVQRTTHSLYDACQSNEREIRSRASDFGITSDHEGLAIDYNNPRLLKIARRYIGNGLSLRHLCEQIYETQVVKGRTRRFGKTRVVKNWIRLTPGGLATLNLEHEPPKEKTNTGIEAYEELEIPTEKHYNA